VCGGVYDWSTGLLYKDRRYFDPVLGIWLVLIPLVVVQSWKKRRKGTRDFPWATMVVMIVGLSGVLVGCGVEETPTPEPTVTVTCTEIPTLTLTPTQIATLASILPTETPVPPTETPTPIPWPIPDCTPSAGEHCINPEVDTERVMVAHVVLQEGGTTIGLQGMYNIAQVIRNRINDTSGEFPYDTATGIVSQDNGGAFNAWKSPSAREGAYYWSQALTIADSLISGDSTFAHDPGVENCLFFQSCYASDHPKTPEVPRDKNWEAKDSGGGRAQYYYKSYPDYGCIPTTVP
jgi:hypothetical protein